MLSFWYLATVHVSVIIVVVTINNIITGVIISVIIVIIKATKLATPDICAMESVQNSGKVSVVGCTYLIILITIHLPDYIDD